MSTTLNMTIVPDDDDLPGQGFVSCQACSRHFIDQQALDKHIRNVKTRDIDHRISVNGRRRRRRNDKLNSVKRALFIDGNLLEHHRKTFEFLKKEMTKIEDEQCAKYNFDFKNEKPLDGNYDWVKTDKSASKTSTK
ncbi:uncharacterized protein LOC107369676 [Tetranychus urticae]|uniref:Cyclin-dependent kinase inhibitor domain-containing protein n=1 Tax=Tetranychus urticae TaxID=32264 RepID=T1L2C8_TETUR|nr:uncharacterized protein LOC107369676 [Tetranychus urticae]